MTGINCRTEILIQRSLEGARSYSNKHIMSDPACITYLKKSSSWTLLKTPEHRQYLRHCKKNHSVCKQHKKLRAQASIHLCASLNSAVAILSFCQPNTAKQS